jgi:hypothetical protein
VVTEDIEVGLILNVRPRVGSDGLIIMDVDATRSARDDNNGTPIPVGGGIGEQGFVLINDIIRTTAQSVVAAYSGQTVIFGGLIQKTRGNQSRRVPFVADIPVLGHFFKYDQEFEERRELLVFLTPMLVTGEEDLEYVKKVESSRMSWCLADVVEAHGDVGVSGGYGLWGPATGQTIYPDVQPTVDDMRRRPRPETPVFIEGTFPPRPPFPYGALPSPESLSNPELWQNIQPQGLPGNVETMPIEASPIHTSPLPQNYLPSETLPSSTPPGTVIPDGSVVPGATPAPGNASPVPPPARPPVTPATPIRTQNPTELQPADGLDFSSGLVMPRTGLANASVTPSAGTGAPAAQRVSWSEVMGSSPPAANQPSKLGANSPTPTPAYAKPPTAKPTRLGSTQSDDSMLTSD